MGLHGELEQLKKALGVAEHVQAELDRRVFYLKTLYDVSMDIFSNVEPEAIIRLFLMMTMGNFGVQKGFIGLVDAAATDIAFLCVGFEDEFVPVLRREAAGLLAGHDPRERVDVCENLECSHFGEREPAFALTFTIDGDCRGVLGLGSKLTGEPFGVDDRELLDTLTNNLVVALKNARYFEEVRGLNRDLQARNVELRAALRKVEILESVKSQLSKFVPTTVCRMIEKSPELGVPDSRDQDVSVLFLDIEGYTRLCEKLDRPDLNDVIERYFSVFMDAIYANNGDVNETAGDGLMVLFLNEDRRANALDAVRTAVAIREKAAGIAVNCRGLTKPLVVNMGINSGAALVGAVKFESYTGSRWTYTARGTTTNIAARLGALATGGGIYLSRSTAERVQDQFPLVFKGKFSLKNVSEEVEIFSF